MIFYNLLLIEQPCSASTTVSGGTWAFVNKTQYGAGVHLLMEGKGTDTEGRKPICSALFRAFSHCVQVWVCLTFCKLVPSKMMSLKNSSGPTRLPCLPECVS